MIRAAHGGDGGADAHHRPRRQVHAGHRHRADGPGAGREDQRHRGVRSRSSRRPPAGRAARRPPSRRRRRPRRPPAGRPPGRCGCAGRRAARRGARASRKRAAGTTAASGTSSSRRTTRASSVGPTTFSRTCSAAPARGRAGPRRARNTLSASGGRPTRNTSRHDATSVSSEPSGGPSSADALQVAALRASACRCRCAGRNCMIAASGHGEQEAAAEALQRAGAGDDPHLVRRRADERAAGEADRAEDQRRPDAAAVVQRAAHGQAGGHHHGVDADHERVEVDAADVARRARQRRGDHQHVERGQERRAARAQHEGRVRAGQQVAVGRPASAVPLTTAAARAPSARRPWWRRRRRRGCARASTRVGSASSTTRSASSPGVSRPRRRSWPAAHAAPGGERRRAPRAASSACSGRHGGRSSSVRATAAPTPASAVELLDRRVGAEGQHGAGVEQRAPGVGASRRARRARRRRHRGRSGRGTAASRPPPRASRSAARRSGRAIWACSMRGRSPAGSQASAGGLEGVERDAVGAVADGVDGDGEAALRRPAHEVLEARRPRSSSTPVPPSA